MKSKQINIKEIVLAHLESKQMSHYDLVQLVKKTDLPDKPSDRSIYYWLSKPDYRLGDDKISVILTVLGIKVKC